MGLRALAAFAAILAALLITSTPRPIGDAREYLAVADNLSRLESPSLTRAQAAGITGRLLTGPDGRLDTIHFWIYPALVAGPLALIRTLGGDPAIAFAFVNAALLLAAAAIASTRLSWQASCLLFLSPVIWWTDKVHTEIFTFSLIAIAMCALPRRPVLAGVSLGLATAQNPPIGILLGLSAAGAAVEVPCRRLLEAFGVGAFLAALHPLYYAARLGRFVPLAETTAAPLSWPSFSAVAIDPNIGLLFNDPFLPLAVVVFTAYASADRTGTWTRWQAIAVLSGVALLLVFGSVVNINHGGTPGMSRHALWLIPLAIPFLPERTAPQPRVLMSTLALAGAIWSIAFYRPSVGEEFLTPTRAAAWMWSRHPSWNNPPREIFAERVRHRENVLPGAAATPDCAKILTWDGVGPPECPRMAVPAKCERGPCYANRQGDGTYRFVMAP